MSIGTASRLGIVVCFTSAAFVACGGDETTTPPGSGGGNTGAGPTSSNTSSSSSKSSSTASGGGQGGTGGAGAMGGAGGTGGTAGSGGTGGVPLLCGNDMIDAGEQCDGAMLGGQSCTDFGFTNPAGLACDATCNFDQAGCTPTCDGAAAEPGEYCDGADLDNHDCTEFGYVNPDGLVCLGTCAGADSSACLAACNDVLEPNEDCDGADLNGEDCTGFGFQNPVGLVCTGCAFDSSGCTGTCDGTLVEPDEECDGADLNGAACTTFGYVDPAGLSCNACSYDTAGCTAVCGNGVKEPTEECDGSASTPDQVCTPQCTIQFLSLHINEIYYNPPNADVGCYVEIVGPPNLSLTGYSLKMINGANGQTIGSGVSLTGQSLSATGYFVVAQDAMVTVAPTSNSMINTQANLQNGPDNIQLLNGMVVVDAVGYGIFAATDTFAGEGTATPGATDVIQSVSRLPNGADTGNNLVDFDLGTQTPGAPNAP